jgi:hypothetical protein
MSMAMQRHNHQWGTVSKAQPPPKGCGQCQWQCRGTTTNGGLPPRPNRHPRAAANVNGNAEAQPPTRDCLQGTTTIRGLRPMSMAMQRHSHLCGTASKAHLLPEGCGRCQWQCRGTATNAGMPPRPSRHCGAVADVNGNAEAQLQLQGCLGGRPAIRVLPPIPDHSHFIVIFHPHFILISFNSVQIYLSKSIVRIEIGRTVKK